MNSKTLLRLITGGATLLACCAFGQSEQWLQYHTGEGRSYKRLELTNTPPAGVALPKLNGKAWFARWKTPMDPSGGRWVCFDHSRKSGPCDRMFIDSNGNGSLEDEKPVPAKIDNYYGIFPGTPVVFKGEDGPITYHVSFRFYQYEQSSPSLLAMSSGWYEGNANFDGAKKRVRLIDADVSGSFNDMVADPYESDRVEVDGESHFLGRMLEVNNTFYQIEVARDGAFIKVKKAAGVQLGTVRVQEDIAEFSAFGENGHFTRKPQKGEFTIPAGKYRGVSWQIKRKDDKGTPWTLSGNRFPDTATFEVAANKTTDLEIGEPVRAVVEAQEGTDREFTLRLKFLGRQNESVDIERDGQNPPRPKLAMASADGKFTYTNSFEFG